MPKGIPESQKPFSVLYWGSHPDQDNDDCYTGQDFETKEEAIAFFKGEVQDPPNLPGYYHSCVAFIEIDGLEDSELRTLGLERVRKNPAFRKESENDDGARSEMIMQAGMMGGLVGLNEAQSAFQDGDEE